MTAQTILKPICLDESVVWYPENGRYEPPKRPFGND
jgi:hypothetical protein